MSSAHSKIQWLQLISELGYVQEKATPLHADNISAISIAANLVFHEHTKHIEVDDHFIRETFFIDIISLPHIPSEF